jgi:periplasmic divalent cation tolerance protein
MESASECLLLLKTVAAQLAALEARILTLHSYDTPEFLVLPIDSASEGYLAWMRANLLQP